MKEKAQELIDSGNSREKAEGYGMMRIINIVNRFINYSPDTFSDGEIINLIHAELNKHK